MRALHQTIALALITIACATNACGEPSVDDSRSDRRLIAPTGVIQGTVTYQGPPPCSQNGHVIGSALLLVFDENNPPPPAGLANDAVNFGVVAGDVLFANEPRSPGVDRYCPDPKADPLLASAPFTIAPMDAGRYFIQAFYDYTGDFLPTFKIRNLPMAGDIGGGYVDVADASRPDPSTMGTTPIGDNPNYRPSFRTITVGVASSPASPDASPSLAIPATGYVADNIPVSIGTPFRLTRPYFYPEGADAIATSVSPGSAESDLHAAPVLTMPQDWHIKALPSGKSEANIAAQQASFKAMRLDWGLPPAELSIGVDSSQPFKFQISPLAQGGGLFVWQSGASIPETPLVPRAWPLVVFSKLAGARATDPQELTPQGDPFTPVVILQGLTLFQDTLFATAGFGGAPVPKSPLDPAARTDHVTVLVRPSALCFNAAAIDQGGLLVTPFEKGDDPGSSAGPAQPENQVEIADIAGVVANLNNGRRLASGFKFACLPTGRYGVNMVYSTGQAWTVPNEAGSCAPLEGATDWVHDTCTTKPRPVLPSQGNRAVLEVVPAQDPNNCKGDMAVPDECLPCCQRQNAARFPECVGAPPCSQ